MTEEKKAYLVLQRSTDYNDEHVFFSGDSGGSPERIFLDKVKAREACALWNREWLIERLVGTVVPGRGDYESMQWSTFFNCDTETIKDILGEHVTNVESSEHGLSIEWANPPPIKSPKYNDPHRPEYDAANNERAAHWLERTLGPETLQELLDEIMSSVEGMYYVEEVALE